MENSCDVHRRNTNGSKTLPCDTPDTTLTSLLRQLSIIPCCDPFDRNSVYINNTEPPILQSWAYREFPMANPIKGCAELNLHDPSLLPTLQCILQCIGHAQMCITGTQTFPIPIRELGGWNHNTASDKLSETNRHQMLKHLKQYWCYGSRSVIGNRGRLWASRNWSDIGLSPASLV